MAKSTLAHALGAFHPETHTALKRKTPLIQHDGLESMRSLAQAVVDSIQRSLAVYGRMSRWQWVVLKLKFAVRRMVLAFHDPRVVHQVGRHRLALPLSHNLPIDDAATPGRCDNLTRIASRVCDDGGSSPFVDIGANVGDTVAYLRTKSQCPILAIEGDDEFYAFLEENMKSVPRVWTFRGLLGDRSHTVSGMLGTNYGGSKQVMVNAGETGILRFLTLPDVLDQFPQFKLARMVKIDTDGYDCKIIRGAQEWLQRVRPVLFFEYDPHHLGEQGDDGISIFGLLRTIGYESMLVFEGSGEFMFSADLSQERLLEELHTYFVGRRSKRYADVCVFHSGDRLLFEQCRSEELAQAVRSRSEGGRSATI